MRLSQLAAFAAVLTAALAPSGTAAPAVGFSDRARGRLVLTAPAYRLTLSKGNGALLSLVDAAGGGEVLRGAPGACLWRAGTDPLDETYGTCGGRFSYRWNGATSTLRLAYAGPALDVTVDVVAAASSFDLRATVANHSGHSIASVLLPADVVGSVATARAGYSPTYLPGVKLRRGFFSHVGANVLVYPSRWAFADYLALDVAHGRVALYSVNPVPAPLAPARVGFVHTDRGACSGGAFCIQHAFLGWTRDGETWSGPAVRIVV